MIKRIKELAYDTVANKFVAREPSGKKVEVPLGSQDYPIKDRFYSYVDSAPDVSLGSNQSKLLVPDFVEVQKGALSLDPDEPNWISVSELGIYWVEAQVSVRTAVLAATMAIAAVSFDTDVDYADVSPIVGTAPIDNTTIPTAALASNTAISHRLTGPLFCPAGGHIAISAADYNGNANGREVAADWITIKRIS